MKNALFQIMYYRYQIVGWQQKKKQLQSAIDFNKFQDYESFQTDRRQNGNSYLIEFVNIFETELDNFRSELELDNIHITDVWTVRYKTGQFHAPHTHSSFGYSGVLYLDYDETVHTGTYFVNSITDPITDLTNGFSPTVQEGDMVIAPSNILHFTYPNKSDKDRLIVGFDVKFQQ